MKEPGFLFRQSNVNVVVSFSGNVKTGKKNSCQVWYLPANTHPIEARRNGADEVVCGDCKHRPSLGGGCYVVGMPLVSIQRAINKGSYKEGASVKEVISAMKKANKTTIRFGAWGDPYFAMDLTLKLAREAKKQGMFVLGYTHQWNKKNAHRLRPYIMASVDSIEEYKQAKTKNWRTFRVGTFQEKGKEIICPATINTKVTCDKCNVCGGHKGRGHRDVVVMPHGPMKNKVLKVID